MRANICGAAQVSYLNAQVLNFPHFSQLIAANPWMPVSFLFLVYFTQPHFQALSAAFSSSLAHMAANMAASNPEAAYLTALIITQSSKISQL